MLLRQGDPGTHVLALKSGHAMATLTDANGQRTILSLCGPGDLLGELSVLDGQDRSASCLAVDDSVVHPISAEAFLRFARDHGLIETLLRHSIARLREAENLRHRLANERVPARLLQALERFLPPGTGDHRINLTQSELAELVGASRNAIVAALRPWLANGWVTSHPVRGLIVKDLRAVRRQEQELSAGM